MGPPSPLGDAASVGGIDTASFRFKDSDGNWTKVGQDASDVRAPWHRIRFELTNWDSTELADDTYDYCVRGYDYHGNWSEDCHSVTIDNSGGGSSLSPGGPLSSSDNCPPDGPTNCELTLETTRFRGIDTSAVVRVTDENATGQDTAGVSVSSTADTSGITVILPRVSAARDTVFEGTFTFTEGDSRKDLIAVDPSVDSTAVQVDYSPQGLTVMAEWRPDTSPGDLSQVRTWPNPYDPGADGPLVFQNLPADRSMEISILTTNGDRVRTLRVGDGIEYHASGNYARWDGTNYAGTTVASGMYLYVVKTRSGSTRGMITLVKTTSYLPGLFSPRGSPGLPVSLNHPVPPDIHRLTRRQVYP
ncbi:MAG: hypothetical protein ABEK50_00255 [bacterium]